MAEKRKRGAAFDLFSPDRLADDIKWGRGGAAEDLGVVNIAPLLSGEAKDTEKFVAIHGVEKTIDYMNSAINKWKGDKDATEARDYLIQTRDYLLGQQGS